MYHGTWRKGPERSNHKIHRRQYLKSYNVNTISICGEIRTASTLLRNTARTCGLIRATCPTILILPFTDDKH
jgi:hypothetical protein